MFYAPQYGRRQKPRPAKIAAALLALCLTGCTYATIEARHTSHPFAGPPFGPRTDEDSLNTVNACIGVERGSWFAENCLGYKLGEGGFYGPPVTYDARVGKRFEFRR